MPTRAKNRQLDVTITPWHPRKRTDGDGLGELRTVLGVRRGRVEHRRVQVLDGADLATMVVFHVSFDPEVREPILQNPIELHTVPELRATDLRLPVQTYLRAIRHAIGRIDEGHLRYEVRNGKTYLLGERAPIVLGAPPQRRYHRASRDLAHVAEIARANPRTPIKAVRLALNVSQRTAARRLAEARAEGLLE